MKTMTSIPKSDFNISDRVLNLMSYFEGMEKVMKSLLMISMALAMREILYSAFFESMQYYKNGEKNEKMKMHNKHISEVNNKNILIYQLSSLLFFFHLSYFCFFFNLFDIWYISIIFARFFVLYIYENTRVRLKKNEI